MLKNGLAELYMEARNQFIPSFGKNKHAAITIRFYKA